MTPQSPSVAESGTRYQLFTVLIGIPALVVFLQGLWAGIFLQHDGERDSASSWIDVHARGADLAILLALAATVVGFIKIRQRRDLWIGSAVFTVLLIAESYLGGLIRDQSKDVLTAVHVPLAMLLMAFAAWLPMRARTLGRVTGDERDRVSV